jgi:hypothetical protein
MQSLRDTLKRPISTKLGTTVILCAALVASGGVFTAAKGEFDLSGLNQQVQRHDEQIQNHEGRINNLEQDVTKVQQETGVAPSDNKVAPTVVTTKPAESTPSAQPAPVEAPKPASAPWPMSYSVNTVNPPCANPGNYYTYTYNTGDVGPTTEWREEFLGKPQHVSTSACSVHAL